MKVNKELPGDTAIKPNNQNVKGVDWPAARTASSLPDGGFPVTWVRNVRRKPKSETGGSLRVSKLALDVLNMHGVMVSDFFVDPQLSEFGFRRTHP